MELLALFLMAAAVTAFLQMKDWGYHFLPIHFTCGLMESWIALKAIQRWRGRCMVDRKCRAFDRV